MADDKKPDQISPSSLERTNPSEPMTLVAKMSESPDPSMSSSKSDLPLRDFDSGRIKPSEVPVAVTGKRKHVGLSLPPAKKARQQSRNSPDSQESLKQEPKAPFSGIWSALLEQNDLLLNVTTNYLSPHDLFNLYAIDRHFHFLVNSHLTTYIKQSARRWAPLSLPRDPESAQPGEQGEVINAMVIFPWGFYRNLCVRDPVERSMGEPPKASPAGSLPSDDLSRTSGAATVPTATGKSRLILSLPGSQPKGDIASIDSAISSTARMVPGFRYLFFLIHRIRTIRSILRTLGWDHDIHCPAYTASTLAKMWVLMDLPTTGARIAMIHNKELWAVDDLYRANLFSIKLDMAFSHPINGEGISTLRKLMWAQRSLTVLDQVLLRNMCRTEAECFNMCAMWKPIEGNERLPHQSQGVLEKEGWGNTWRLVRGTWTRTNAPYEARSRAPLLRPDELVMRESIRRNLGIQKHFASMLRSGYLDPRTLRIIRYQWPPEWWLKRPGSAAATWIKGKKDPPIKYGKLPLRRNGLFQFENQVEPLDEPVDWDEDAHEDDGLGFWMRVDKASSEPEGFRIDGVQID